MCREIYMLVLGANFTEIKMTFQHILEVVPFLEISLSKVFFTSSFIFVEFEINEGS